MSDKNKIGAIGDAESVLVFKAFGVSVFEATADNAAECRHVVDMWAKQGYSVIFITEEAAAPIESTIDRYTRAMYPAIIPIPSVSGSSGLALERIRKNVEKAVGMNIL